MTGGVAGPQRPTQNIQNLPTYTEQFSNLSKQVDQLLENMKAYQAFTSQGQSLNVNRSLKDGHSEVNRENAVATNALRTRKAGPVQYGTLPAGSKVTDEYGPAPSLPSNSASPTSIEDIKALPQFTSNQTEISEFIKNAKTGDYIFRPSSNTLPNVFTMAIKTENGITNLRVKIENGKFGGINDKRLVPFGELLSNCQAIANNPENLSPREGGHIHKLPGF